MSHFSESGGRAVPSQRLSRLWHLGRATTDLAAGVGVRGLMELARSRGSESNRIRLSPVATQRFTDRLARMRGAVMKMGQMMSMDGADVFTPEAAAIMGSLRERAEPMPLSQLAQVLEREWGADWNKNFRRFDFTPIAAASIGQVHRAETKDGRQLALKIQFPGVRESIDSDIDNLGFLARTLGMAPKGMDPQPLLDEARRQLHQEADYQAEAEALEAYRARIGDDPAFLVPAVHRDISTAQVLAMDYIEGVSIDRLSETGFSRQERDRVSSALTDLTLRELFGFQLAQTDPNFGNYFYQPESGRVVLLDFGATARIAPSLVAGFRRLAAAGMADDVPAMHQAIIDLGYLRADAPRQNVDALTELMRLSGEMLRTEGIYDFGTSDLFERIYQRGRELYLAGAFSELPDPSSLFLHRKFVGTFMLCRRLRARIDFRAMMTRHL
ncbi:ABC1 kinase family protein [Thiorhodovibrio frisius]|uniref:Putative unusual protein kinase n=1 Tax=Thiorhodovibrio frisius TaxID=631362 RepID=H8Z002_9GAMM|nr:AarF/ABC1/UbiB kinase family protein [Thiorhodovibrio frisius]EIC21175.1 putative unusual protein kinase [Thiorhodovibrio frisius]WPL23751.1 putative ubiquinone biosynthesis protein UbiB [Thiorhodovibrio frisius]